MEKVSHSGFNKKPKFYLEKFEKSWDFQDAFLKQSEKLEAVDLDNERAYILSGAHQPVFTLGKSLSSKALDIPKGFVPTDRGGQVMYHGPGQLTLYPIFKLKNYFSGPREYTKYLFDLCIEYFQEKHGIKLICKQNGLWTQDLKKVGFIGLRIKKGTVYHGLSLNYNADLGSFLKHSPCDISGEQAGNLFGEGADVPDLEEEARLLSEAFLAGLTLKKAGLI